MSEYKIKEEEITDIRKLLEPGLKKVLEDHEKWVESSRGADPSFRTFWEMNGIYDNSKEGRKRRKQDLAKQDLARYRRHMDDEVGMKYLISKENIGDIDE